MPENEDSRYNGWSEVKNRYSPKNAIEAHAHAMFDNAYKLYQASAVASATGDTKMAENVLQEVEMQLKQARKAVKEFAENRKFHAKKKKIAA